MGQQRGSAICTVASAVAYKSSTALYKLGGKNVCSAMAAMVLDSNVREKKRIDHLRTNMIAAMIKFIGIQENSQQEILKTFKEDKDARATRATNPKTSAEDKTKEAKTELRIQGLDEFRTFTDKLSFATNHYKRDDFRRILDNTNIFHVKSLTEILRYFHGDQFVDEEVELKKM